MKKTVALSAVLIGTLVFCISIWLPQVDASRRLVLDGIEFKTGTSILEQLADADLQKLLDRLKNDSALSFEIQGHTVPGESEKADQELSRQRAQAVKQWLVDRGIVSERIRVVGYGSRRPLVENTTAKGRGINERIEIVTFSSTFPVAELAEEQHTFDPVPEGSFVLHEFRIQNTGEAILEISKVKTG